jgi:uncharacterized RDD family membrane protein YckC
MNSDSIKTYAGFWQRMMAFVLDYVIILFYLGAVTLLFLLLNSLFSIDDWLFTDRVSAQFTGFLLITLPVTLYFVISESSNRQATWGKQRMKLSVADENGAKISFWRSLARTFLKFIPWELSHTLIWKLSFSPQEDNALIYYGFGFVYLLVGLNIASLLITKKHQTLYDLLTKTYVIKQAV